jgi:hypothetical protein
VVNQRLRVEMKGVNKTLAENPNVYFAQ